MSLTDELLKAYEFQIEQFDLIPSAGGAFEVWVDDDLIYSKKATRRHVYPGEVLQLVQDKVGPPKPRPE